MRLRYLLLLLVMLFAVQGCASRVAGKVGSISSADRRTAGTVLDDSAIETRSGDSILLKYKTAHITVTSFNRFALITGEAPNEEAKTGIARIVGMVPNVKGFANEVIVGESSGMRSRSNDAVISSDIRFRLNKSKQVQADQVRVVTERGVVYLMGLVTHAEADAASDIASTTKGVNKVVRVFEYID